MPWHLSRPPQARAKADESVAGPSVFGDWVIEKEDALGERTVHLPEGLQVDATCMPQLPYAVVRLTVVPAEASTPPALWQPAPTSSPEGILPARAQCTHAFLATYTMQPAHNTA
jgi:hypothetical protein